MIPNHSRIASIYARKMENIERRERLGRNIRERRLEAGISTRAFARMAGTSHTYLWQVENGTVGIGFDKLCRFADALGISVHELIDF